MKRWFFRGGLVAVALCGILEGAAADLAPEPISRPDVQTYFRVLQRLDTKLPDLMERLIDRYGEQDNYLPKQVQWAVDQKEETEPAVYFKPVHRPAEVPPGAFSAQETRTTLKVLAATKKADPTDYYTGLEQKFGQQPWYLAQEIRDVEDSGKDPGKSVVAYIRPSVPDAGWRMQPLLHPWRNLKLRQSWSDLLIDEDRTLGDAAKTKQGDLTGGTFSFTRDNGKHEDAWTAVGSLGYPVGWVRPVASNGSPVLVAIAPSFSINHTPNDDPTKRIDAVYYRLGTLMQWEAPSGWWDGGWQLRSALVWGTNSAHRTSMPAFEADLEPDILFPPVSGASRSGSDGRPSHPRYSLGYKNVLIDKEPELADQSDNSLLDFQLRTWVHIEGGDLQRSGATLNLVPGSFFRVGPAVQAQFNAPKFWRGASVTGSYTHFATQHGHKGNEELVKISASLVLFNDVVANQKASLTATYTDGGLDFTKQAVDTLTLGLSLLF